MWDAIIKRFSVRSFEKRPLSFEDKKEVRKILDAAEEKSGPFGHGVRFFTHKNKDDTGKEMGTHGFIKHPAMFVGGVVEHSLEGLVDYGFLFEEVILRLTQIALGTVWLGGTFDRGAFDVKTGKHEVIPAVSPVGYPADRPHREALSRGITGSRRRKPFDELFSVGEAGSDVPGDHAFHPHLKAVQAGPSASNKQPWRIVVMADTFHVYLNRSDGYNHAYAVDMQAIDIGIALSHLYHTLKADGYAVTFNKEEPPALEDAEYILSLRASRDHSPDA